MDEENTQINEEVTDEEVTEETPVVDEEVDVEVKEPSEENEESQEEKIKELVDEVKIFYSNLAEDMDERVLGRISSELISDYKKDKESRSDWEKSYTSGLDLLGFKYDNESRPFQGASSVTHPLLAESVTQFQAQAYKELLPSDGPVRTQVVGEQTREREDQAQRVKEFMNYMIMEQMEEYTPDFDQLLFYLPLAGSAFKKIYYDEVMQRAIAKFIPAEDLIVPYYATDLKDCERITHVVKMSENDILKKQRTGFYRDVEILPSRMDDDAVQEKYDSIEGVSASADKEYQFNILEMHVDLDLEEYESEVSEKNIKVPYIVTIDEGSQEVLAIYRNYDMNDALMKRKEYFVHYKFLPGLGFYGFGLIHMIGGLSKTATAALRQLLDAGTLSNLPAGFKSRGMRIRDDDQPFQPGEFRDVDAPGGNIKDQFQILPFKEPSSVLFSLLGFVVQAGQRFAAITDNAIGNDAQNRAVGTTIALLERGSRVMSAIHKRCYYAMRQEFRLLASIFGTYLPPIYPYAVYGGNRLIKVADFSPEVDVIPVADPNIFSMAQRVTLAQTQLQIAQSNPQLHNVREAYRRVYEALGTKQIDSLLKPERIEQPLDPAIENAMALRMEIPKAYPEQNHDAHIISHTAFIKSRMVQINPMVYALLQAHIMEHVSFKARALILQELQAKPETLKLQQDNPEAFLVITESLVADKIAQLVSELQLLEGADEKKDPLVQLKQQEMDLRALDMQRKIQEHVDIEERKMGEFEQKLDLEKMKREDSEEQGEERIRIAEEKLKVAKEKNEKK
tara:strand:- start:15292 stop:17664 length:2373 start_codon:yes stop_codon:yes gene_type:complete